MNAEPVDIVGGCEQRIMGCVGFVLLVTGICAVIDWLNMILLPLLFVALTLAALGLAIMLLIWVSRSVSGTIQKRSYPRRADTAPTRKASSSNGKEERHE